MKATISYSLCAKRNRNLLETRLISEVRRCLGNSELGGKKIALNSTCPVGCVLWEIHSSKIKKYAGRRVKVFFPECGPVSKLKKNERQIHFKMCKKHNNLNLEIPEQREWAITCTSETFFF